MATALVDSALMMVVNLQNPQTGLMPHYDSGNPHVGKTYPDELGVRCDDRGLAIDCPLHGAPVLSEKDLSAPRLAGIPEDRLSRFQP